MIGVGDGIAVGVNVGVAVGVFVGVGVWVGVKVGVWEGVKVGLGVGVFDGVKVGVGVAVGNGTVRPRTEAGDEAPPAFTARTLRLYSVSALRPRKVYWPTTPLNAPASVQAVRLPPRTS